VHHAPEREEVAAPVARLAPAHLLGADVVRRADHQRGLAVESVVRHQARRAREPEVHELRAVGRNQHVLGLDVAVHDATAVGVAERVGDVAGDEQRVARAQRPVRV
jgi:hypothetical protein